MECDRGQPVAVARHRRRARERTVRAHRLSARLGPALAASPATQTARARRPRALHDIFDGPRRHRVLGSRARGGARAASRRSSTIARALDVPWVVTNDVHYARARDRIVHDVLSCAAPRAHARRDGHAPPSQRRVVPAERRADGAALAAIIPKACARRSRSPSAARSGSHELHADAPRLSAPARRERRRISRAARRAGRGRALGRRSIRRSARSSRTSSRSSRKLGLAGYFLIVWDIVRFARREGILCQGRGSAANSAVCFCLGITAVDPDQARAPLRAIPERGAQRGARHRHRLRAPRARARAPVRVRALRPRARRDGVRADHLSRPLGRARRRARARLLRRAGRHARRDERSLLRARDGRGAAGGCRCRRRQRRRRADRESPRARNGSGEPHARARGEGAQRARERARGAAKGTSGIEGRSPERRTRRTSRTEARTRSRPIASCRRGWIRTPRTITTSDAIRPPRCAPRIPARLARAARGSIPTTSACARSPRSWRGCTRSRAIARSTSAASCSRPSRSRTIVPIEPACDGGSHRDPVGEGRPRCRGAREDRPARPRHAHADPGLPAVHPHDARRTRSISRTLDFDDQAVYDDLCARRHDRRLPGGEPRADEHAAAAQAALLLRSRRRGRDHSAGADPGRHGASVSPAQSGRGGSDVPASVARADPRAHARRAALPGAGDAGGDRRRGLHAGRGGHAAPRDGAQAQPRADGGDLPEDDRRDERNGISQDVAQRIYNQINAFADYGFPESHAASFALLVYASAYLKHYYAPEFTAAILNAQPMGFYAPGTLIEDAKRHGVVVRPVDCSRSALRRDARAARAQQRRQRCGSACASCAGSAAQRASCCERALESGGTFASIDDVVARSGLDRRALRALAEAGAFDCFVPDEPSARRRRAALWRMLEIAARRRGAARARRASSSTSPAPRAGDVAARAHRSRTIG